jgi:hypothetical protein
MCVNHKVLRGVAWALGIGLVLLVSTFAITELRVKPRGMVECSPGIRSTNPVTGAGPSQVLASFPVKYELERTISPHGLRSPDGSVVISPVGAAVSVVVLTYDAEYLKILRVQTGPGFVGIAPLDPVSVPAGVKVQYSPDVFRYVIAPNSCLPS